MYCSQSLHLSGMFMLFVVDFDGTISKRDTIDQLLEKFADPSWETLEKDWLDGKMTALECMSKQIDMVDSDLLSLENFFRSIQLDETFLPFYEYVKKFAKLVIASDGLDHSIKVATRQAGCLTFKLFLIVSIIKSAALKLHFR